MSKIDRKIILLKDVVFKKGTILNENSGTKTQYGYNSFEGLLSMNKDNVAYLNIDTDALKEGKDYIYVKE